MNWRAYGVSVLMVGGVGLFLADNATGEEISAKAERGQVFVEANCSECHAVGTDGASPLDGAPPLRTLSQRYPIDNLAEAFAEGIVTGHPGMPEFELPPEEVDALLAYLSHIQEPAN